jgi:predicted dinucleotide-binding enzyme
MEKKKIGILGSGEVGQALARGFIGAGYEVMVGSRDGSKAANLDVVLNMDVAAGTFRGVAEWGELIILAVKGSAVEGVASVQRDLLAGKTVIDISNPIADSEPENGVLRYFTNLEESLAELVQAAAPEAKVVKAWNSVGHMHMIHPDFGTVPTMPICGDDENARKEVAALLVEFGWEVEDMGSLTSARAIEPLAMLLSIPGFQRGEWDHVFKLVKK